MSNAERRRRAALDALYAELPAIECRGLCWGSCSHLPLFDAEQRRIADESGILIPVAAPAPCPALTVLKRCQAHVIRPLVCRLFGLVDNMPCPHGCVPEGGRLSVAAGYEILARGMEIDGRHREAAGLRAAFRTPELVAANTVTAMTLAQRGGSR